jgi:hypothetical protein
MPGKSTAHTSCGATPARKEWTRRGRTKNSDGEILGIIYRANQINVFENLPKKTDFAPVADVCF